MDDGIEMAIVAALAVGTGGGGWPIRAAVAMQGRENGVAGPRGVLETRQTGGSKHRGGARVRAAKASGARACGEYGAIDASRAGVYNPPLPSTRKSLRSKG